MSSSFVDRMRVIGKDLLVLVSVDIMKWVQLDTYWTANAYLENLSTMFTYAQETMVEKTWREVSKPPDKK